MDRKFLYQDIYSAFSNRIIEEGENGILLSLLKRFVRFLFFCVCFFRLLRYFTALLKMSRPDDIEIL